MGGCAAVEGKRSILLNWQPAFQQGNVETREGHYRGTLARAGSVQQLSALMDGSKACEGCLMFLSGSGLGAFQKSILVLSLNYRQTPALKSFNSVLARMSLGRWCKAALNR